MIGGKQCPCNCHHRRRGLCNNTRGRRLGYSVSQTGESPSRFRTIPQVSDPSSSCRRWRSQQDAVACRQRDTIAAAVSTCPIVLFPLASRGPDRANDVFFGRDWLDHGPQPHRPNKQTCCPARHECQMVFQRPTRRSRLLHSIWDWCSHLPCSPCFHARRQSCSSILDA